ncbi:hypothetical protein EEL31_23930 [Brevibacillus laterosporus]|nr:hypothetical protein [Brevibacillus laterosporus]TPG71180.1 hypothetical protein EEL31_23930 [Brevibacillus laterosporus]
MTQSNEALAIRIDKVEEEVKETRENIKVISESTVALRENLTRLTAIQELQSSSNNQMDSEEKQWRRQTLNKVLAFVGFIILSLIGANMAGVDLLK